MSSKYHGISEDSMLNEAGSFLCQYIGAGRKSKSHNGITSIHIITNVKKERDRRLPVFFWVPCPNAALCDRVAVVLFTS